MKPLIVIITGLSGSGKTIALRALEDVGFFCVDNLPTELIDSFISTITEKSGRRRIAVGIDVREKDFLQVPDRVLNPLRERYDINVIFLEADSEALIRRYKETRRPHPLVGPGGPDITEAISMEIELLRTLRANADRIIDTSAYTPHQLRQFMSTRFGAGTVRDSLNVTLMSFGYKYGIPLNADLLFDVRFMPNPYFVPELRDLDGRDREVRDYVLNTPHAAEFIEKLGGFLHYLIPLYVEEGKAYLTIGIGCTGGRHRSPVIIEEIASAIKDEPVRVDTVHRDI